LKTASFSESLEKRLSASSWMSDSPPSTRSARLHGLTVLSLKGYSWIFWLRGFLLKSVENFQVR
jgi:hypothetical protein